MKQLFNLKSHKGFTLVELLLIIGIIGILVAIAIPQFLAYKERAYDSQTKAALHSLYLACKSYWADNTADDICTLGSDFTTTYGFTPDITMRLTIRDGTENSFNVRGQHTSSSNSYSIDSLGNIHEG